MSFGSIVVPSPLGPLTVFAVAGEIVSLDWGKGMETEDTPQVLKDAAVQLAEYFAGKRRDFTLPLNPEGSAFQKKVWDAMRAIPYGQTRTYGEVARELRTAAQAVGGACGANHIPIIIPCHRILGTGSLGGYSGMGALDTKRELLRLEGAIVPA